MRARAGQGCSRAHRGVRLAAAVGAAGQPPGVPEVAARERAQDRPRGGRRYGSGHGRGPRPSKEEARRKQPPLQPRPGAILSANKEGSRDHRGAAGVRRLPRVMPQQRRAAAGAWPNRAVGGASGHQDAANGSGPALAAPDAHTRAHGLVHGAACVAVRSGPAEKSWLAPCRTYLTSETRGAPAPAPEPGPLPPRGQHGVRGGGGPRVGQNGKPAAHNSGGPERTARTTARLAAAEAGMLRRRPRPGARLDRDHD